MDPEHAEQKYGGKIVFGDEESLFFSRLNLDNLDAIGVFRAAHDGSGEELVTTNSFVDMIVPRRDAYVVVYAPRLDHPIYVSEYIVGEGVTQIGCIDGRETSAHALSIADEDVLVAIFRDYESTILKIGD